MKPEGFANQPTNAVAADRIAACLKANSHAQPGRVQIVWSRHNSEKAIADPLSAGVYRVEFVLAPQSARRGKSQAGNPARGQGRNFGLQL